MHCDDPGGGLLATVVCTLDAVLVVDGKEVVDSVTSVVVD